MVDPALSLLIFFAAVLAACVLFWPGRGVAARLLRISELTERVRLEDALKHLFKCEYAGRRCSVESLAGAAGVSRSRALHLLTRLEEMGLAEATSDGFILSSAGRDYAIHIVRTHRLLERYLADRTGVDPLDWHGEADRREHKLSPEEREFLASELGHPLFDPHGDPIPSPTGELPPRTGVPLTSLRAGEVGSIVHLGDEPREVFETLSTAGLSPQMTVQVLESDGRGVRFEVDGRDEVLPPIMARNITVERLPEARLDAADAETLADLSEGDVARILGIHPGLQGAQRRRLLDLGMVPGTRIEAELRSAGGDPMAYRVRGALIALREDQARWIQVDRNVEA